MAEKEKPKAVPVVDVRRAALTFLAGDEDARATIGAAREELDMWRSLAKKV